MALFTTQNQLSIWTGLKINNYKIKHKDILNELNVVFTWKTTFTILKKKRKQKKNLPKQSTLAHITIRLIG